MSSDGPILHRPIPRRPFGLSLTSPTPPDEDSRPPSPGGVAESPNPRLLDPRFPSTPGELGSGSASLSRAQSIMNLSSGALFGIYSPTVASSPGGRSPGYYTDRDEPDTPGWDADMTRRFDSMYAMAKRASLYDGENADDYDGEDNDAAGHGAAAAAFAERSGATRRTTSWTAVLSVSLVLRAGLLFALGLGYGVLVKGLRDGGNRGALNFLADEGVDGGGGLAAQSQRTGWGYLVFWGATGVVLGGLLPWFDGVWEARGNGWLGNKENGRLLSPTDADSSGLEAKTSTDWALVMRAIGAFAGIVFAIRKLPWASTLQVSVSLALVNPFLWYLIDRSTSGLLLASAVGVAGSAVLLGVNPDVVPTPAALSSSARSAAAAALHHANASAVAAGGGDLFLGGIARQETVEAGIWMLSVLFCSCVCFGNIGRRLAMDRSGAARGRWGDAR